LLTIVSIATDFSLSSQQGSKVTLLVPRLRLLLQSWVFVLK